MCNYGIHLCTLSRRPQATIVMCQLSLQPGSQSVSHPPQKTTTRGGDETQSTSIHPTEGR